MKIKKEVTITQFKEMTHDCDEFWEVIGRKRLWKIVECFLEDCFGDDNGIIDFSAAQDAIRYDGGSILRDNLGVNLKGTIWED